MPLQTINELLNENPALRPYLQRVARHAITKPNLPPRIILGVAHDAVLPALNRLLAGRCQIEGDRIILKLPAEMRPVARWQPLATALGLSEVTAPENGAEARLLETTLKRLHLLFPDESQLLRQLEADLGWRRFIAGGAQQAQQAINIVNAWQRLKATPGITLSQLGSDSFNDSKALRSGTLLGHLERLMRLACDQPDLSASELHAQCGVIDNPYTSHVTIFAPFTFITDDHKHYDYPHALFAAGQAVVLPWESVRRISAIDLSGSLQLTTSENASPFLELVRAGQPALYSAGYPNTAVQTLLKHLAQAGATVLHAGDSDLDGYRIAALIGTCIPLDGLLPLQGLANLPHKELTARQRRRLEQFIAQAPTFRFINELRHTLQHGWVEQEAWSAGNVPHATVV